MNDFKAVLMGPKNVVFEAVERRSPGANEVRATTVFSAVSAGTELAAYDALPPLGTHAPYPRLMGYCNVARIDEVGAEVTNHRPGDLIYTHQSHRTGFTCPSAEVLLTLPADASPRTSAFLYLAALAYAALRRADARHGETLVVQGLGFLGLCAVMLGKLEGLRTIAVGNDATRLALAASVGADQCFGVGEVPPNVANVVVSTVNGWPALREAMQTATTHARIALLGFPGRGEPAPEINPLDPVLFYRKQLSLLSAGYASSERWGGGDVDAASKANLAVLLEKLRSGALELQKLVTHEVPAASLAEVYERLSRRDRSVVGVLLNWEGFTP